MKTYRTKFYVLCLILLVTVSINAQDFQGKAYYFSKTTMDMSRFNRGGQMSEQRKKQMETRMKSRLEKTYVLTFNKEESIFKEDEKLSSPVNGRGPSVWGSSFSWLARKSAAGPGRTFARHLALLTMLEALACAVYTR